MSVSLEIDWCDNTCESVSIASLRVAQMWGKLATELGLPLMSKFYAMIPVTPENVDEFIREVVILRDQFAQDAGNEGWRIAAERLLDAFDRLKRATAWSAHMG